MSAIALLWTIGSIASIVALALVIYADFLITDVRHNEEALMHDLEGGLDTNLPLHVLSKKDDVVFIVVSRSVADAMREFGGAVRLKITPDKFDKRLRHMSIVPAESKFPTTQTHKRRKPRQRRDFPHETKAAAPVEIKR